MTVSTTSIAHQAGTAADHMVTLQQIGKWNLAACGARDYAKDDADGELRFRVGLERSKRIVIVKLMPSDTYSVEVGRTNRNMEYVVEEQAHDVYADQLGETVRRLGDR